MTEEIEAIYRVNKAIYEIGKGITETVTEQFIKQENCYHEFEPTLQGGDTYKCKKCGKEIDMTEEEGL